MNIQPPNKVLVILEIPIPIFLFCYCMNTIQTELLLNVSEEKYIVSKICRTYSMLNVFCHC